MRVVFGVAPSLLFVDDGLFHFDLFYLINYSFNCIG